MNANRLRHSKKVTQKMRVGNVGEDIASIFLTNKGFRLLERNYRKKWGEIDIIAEIGNVVRFVEVKAMSVVDFSREMSHNHEDMVDRRKLEKIARTAALYMEMKKDTREYQVDVVAVLLNESTKVARCRLLEQALEDNVQ